MGLGMGKYLQLMRIRLCCVPLLAVGLGGCVAVPVYPFVKPAKFQYLRCKDISEKIKEAESRHNELRGLMDRAATGTGGTVVALVVYRPEFDQTDG